MNVIKFILLVPLALLGGWCILYVGDILSLILWLLVVFAAEIAYYLEDCNHDRWKLLKRLEISKDMMLLHVCCDIVSVIWVIENGYLENYGSRCNSAHLWYVLFCLVIVRAILQIIVETHLKKKIDET